MRYFLSTSGTVITFESDVSTATIDKKIKMLDLTEVTSNNIPSDIKLLNDVEKADVTAAINNKEAKLKTLANLTITIPEVSHIETVPEVPEVSHQEEVFNADGTSKVPQEFITVIDVLYVAAYDKVVVDRKALTFDVDDNSRSSMNEAITTAKYRGIIEHPWKLADNTIEIVTITELEEALALGIEAKGAIVLGQ